MYHVSAQGVDERMINVHYYSSRINLGEYLIITHTKTRNSYNLLNKIRDIAYVYC